LSGEFSDEEMLKYIRFIQIRASFRPRTYWYETPFYSVIKNAKPYFCFGYRPKDLEHIDVIEQKTWKKHLSYLNRLNRFPLDKAEYYQRIKEVYGINSIRGLAIMIGEDWSCVARTLKVLDLVEPIKSYLTDKCL